MREIKFRAWNKQEKEMFYNVQNTYDYGCTSDNKVMEDRFADVLQQDDKWEVMQYTGLKDKNGKEIYEGDIVKKLIWNELKFENEGDGQDYSYAEVKYIDELSGFHLVNKDNRILWELAQDKYNIEVVGNIWENSELLKEEHK